MEQEKRQVGAFGVPNYQERRYAIVETGGKQYFFVEGEMVSIEKIEGKSGDQVSFTTVLFKRTSSESCSVGKPYIENSPVVCEIVRQVKGKKVIAFRFKRRKKVRTKQGHRQEYSLLKVLSVGTF